MGEGSGGWGGVWWMGGEGGGVTRRMGGGRGSESGKWAAREKRVRRTGGSHSR